MEFSEEWKVSTERPGYRVKTIKHGDCTINIFRPELDDVERKKREKFVADAVGRVLSSYYIRMEREKHEQQNHN